MIDASAAKQLLRHIYKDVFPFVIPRAESQEIRKTKSSPLYGELSFRGVQTLLGYLNPTEQDVFYDLGSGIGKLALQVALTSPVKSCVGIELSTERYNDAVKAHRYVLEMGVLEKSRLRFRKQDLLRARIHDATVVYTCSTAFPDVFMRQLGMKLLSLKPKTRILSLREFPKIENLQFVEEIELNTSWMPKHPGYVYTRT